MEKVLVTGCAGFIGMHLCKSLLNDHYIVYGIDNLNDYYDPNLKNKRLLELKKHKNFQFQKLDIKEENNLKKVFNDFHPSKVVNLAAQAGVRHSLKNPSSYINSNIMGFMNILECCRNFKTEGLIYASSSSVYGKNKKVPFSVDDSVDKPISIYAVSKRANEQMAFSYNHLFGMKNTGLRFFTAYGPWGRPDMAMYIFAEKIMAGESIPVFNNGKMWRDFTYIDDIINGIRLSIDRNYDCEIFNLGNNSYTYLLDVVKIIEKLLDKKADIEFHGMQLGDIKKSYADIDRSKKMLGYKPCVDIESGLYNFINWYKDYNNLI
ncbi:MAG: protein CapI [Euryarchaeota archaeon]|nr:protein CapI [Euryarchaeota archaeon]